MGLQLLAIIQSFRFSFYSSTIFIIFYSRGTFPVLSDVAKSRVILLPRIGYSSFYICASTPSLLGALSRLALKTAALTLYLVISFYSNWLYIVRTSFSSHGSGARKNTQSNSFIMSWLSVISSPSILAFLISRTLVNKLIAYKSRYLATFYILSLLPKNLFQQSFQYRQIV